MFDYSYTFEAIFAVVRISVWFWLLFLVIAPLFLEHVRDLPPVEKTIYSWVGLGGTIIASIFVLSMLHIYDFISIVLVLLLLPLIKDIVNYRDGSVKDYFKRFELQTVVSHVKFIENYNGFSWAGLKKSVTSCLTDRDWGSIYTVLALIIAFLGSITRMYSSLYNASPFSRVWYLHLNRVKNIRLQQYFTDIPDPGGMHSLVSLTSMLTQVSPEMILHLLGALTSFFLCLIVYWATKDITKNEYPMAPVFAVSIYALVPMLFLPVSLDQQIEGNTLDLALCFAIPTITIFVRNLKGRYESSRFYVFMGFLATAMTNLFVAFVLVAPSMLIAMVTLPREDYLRSVGRNLLYLVGISILIITPFLIYLQIYDMNLESFVRGRLYDTTAYSYYPLLLYELPVLSQIYATVAGILLAGNLLGILFKGNKRGIDQIIILLFFLGLSVVYLPQLSIDTGWIDPDQMNGFYALLISILFGLCFANIMRFINWIIRYREKAMLVIEQVVIAATLIVLLYLQGGLQVSRVLPSTLPNGFFEAYYKIIDNHLPYSYATVAPEIDRTLAKNRHFFMNYNYFLDEYGQIDSTYHQWLSVPQEERGSQAVPPPSIFVFVEKPPYGAIQQGILYNPGQIMRDVEQWIDQYRNLENRTINEYYSSEEVTVYEIVNRAEESKIDDVLLHIQPEEKEPSNARQN